MTPPLINFTSVFAGVYNINIVKSPYGCFDSFHEEEKIIEKTAY